MAARNRPQSTDRRSTRLTRKHAQLLGYGIPRMSVDSSTSISIGAPSVHGYAAGYYAAHYADPGSRFDPWPSFVATQASTDNEQRGEKENTDWKVAIQHDLNGDMMVYGSVATGYIAGAIEGGGSTALTKPNEVMAYEVGLKSTLLDGAMRLNIAAFFNDYDGLTTSAFIAQGQTIVAPNLGRWNNGVLGS